MHEPLAPQTAEIYVTLLRNCLKLGLTKKFILQSDSWVSNHSARPLGTIIVSLGVCARLPINGVGSAGTFDVRRERPRKRRVNEEGTAALFDGETNRVLFL